MSFDLHVRVTRPVSSAALDTALADLGAWFEGPNPPEADHGDIAIIGSYETESEAVGSLGWRFDPQRREFTLTVSAGDDDGERDEWLARVFAAALERAGQGEIDDGTRGTRRAVEKAIARLGRARAAFERRCKRRLSRRRPGERTEDLTLRLVLEDEDAETALRVFRLRLERDGEQLESALRAVDAVPHTEPFLEVALEVAFDASSKERAQRFAERWPDAVVSEHLQRAVSFSGARALPYVQFLVAAQVLSASRRAPLQAKNADIRAWLEA